MQLFDTLRGHKATLEIPKDRPLTLYVCGVTPYDTTHIGHAHTFLIFDILIRYVRSQGGSVSYCQNVTDVDDPLFERANRDNIAWDALAQREVDQFIKDCRAMNFIAPDFFPKVSEEILGMIPIIEGLIKNGKAYVSNGNVFFDVSSEPTYGEMARLGGYAELLATANERGNNPNDPNKRDPLDFVLWQVSRPGEPEWPSPWGPGRPGWHIECTTMSTRYLGDQIDIHGGGRDLVFPHHPSEIVQTEGYTNKRPFSQFWVHGGLTWLDGAKMSKSLGNLVFVRDAVLQQSPDSIRWYLASFPYREDFNYIRADAAAAEHEIDRLKAALSANSGSGSAVDVSADKSAFFAALDDDLQMHVALVHLKKIIDAVVAGAGTHDISVAQSDLRACAQVIGFKAAE
jgi:L-cysteine:1D-myo-inositol 2-amino-2-deoxy-alpha-D-glucopyranoside ligase